MRARSVLVERAARGERDALEALVAAHRAEVLRTARHVLGDASAAEDVAQEACLRLQTSLADFRGEAEVGTWLYRVTLNLCRDHLRRVRRRPDHVDVAEAGPAPALRVEPTVERSLDAARTRATVRAALDRLPAEQKEAVVLRFLDDLPYAEIARRTGAPPGTVASRVFRGLERLGRDLAPRPSEETT